MKAFFLVIGVAVLTSTLILGLQTFFLPVVNEKPQNFTVDSMSTIKSTRLSPPKILKKGHISCLERNIEAECFEVENPTSGLRLIMVIPKDANINFKEVLESFTAMTFAYQEEEISRIKSEIPSTSHNEGKEKQTYGQTKTKIRGTVSENDQ